MGRSATASTFVERRARLMSAWTGTAVLFAGRERSRNYGANTFPFRASSHFLYFAGASIPGAALVLRDGRATLHVPRPAEDDALWHGTLPTLESIGEAAGCDAVWSDDLAADLRSAADAATTPAFDAATALERQRALGRSGESLTDADRAFVDAVVGVRILHDDAALRALRDAASATTEAHVRGMRATRPGRTEWEIVADMEHTFAARGMGTSYSSIVTVHGEVLHHHGHANTLAAGDLLLADVGAETGGGWAADVTRTWPVTGTFSPTQRAIYEVVLEAQARAIALVKPGTRYRDVHLEACRALAEGLVALGILVGDPGELVADGAHAVFFPHGVGHLLGLDVHDMEDLGDHAGYGPGLRRAEQFGLGYLRLDRILEPGMAVTIEPGFYRVPAILESELVQKLGKGRVRLDVLARYADVRGIRIEDDVLVTASGNEVLTSPPKSVADVEATVGAAAGATT
ncbi:MAG: aminopeptidase P family protein [Polyangiales bacterium]